jgi:hypothetical protein
LKKEVFLFTLRGRFAALSVRNFFDKDGTLIQTPAQGSLFKLVIPLLRHISYDID